MMFLAAEQYQDHCHELFNYYKQCVLNVLPDVRVEHVGASSIPGAVSKGDLDIFVGIEPRKLDAAVHTLSAIGFSEKQDTLRTPELCMLEADADNVDVALQVLANGSRFEFFLAFRDKLRASSVLLAHYNKLKLNCQGKTPSEYRAIKSVFIEQVLNHEI